MYEFLTFTATLVSGYLLVRAIKTSGAVESVLVFFCVSTAQIVVWGYLLSFLNFLGDVRYWAAAATISVLASSVLFALNRHLRQLLVPHVSIGSLCQYVISAKKWYLEETSLFEKILLTPLILVTASVGVLNLIIVLSAAPHNFDSMVYHLPRMAYYLQHNNLNYYPANYWAQVVHPKNSTLLLIYSYLVSGRNENIMQLVQYSAYWVSVCSIYGISIKVGNSRTQSVFAALVGALLVEWLMEATTTQNDMIITAFCGASIYFLLAFKETPLRKYLALAALGIGLGVGTKASSLIFLPSVVLIALYALLMSKERVQNRLRDLLFLGMFMLFSIVVFALPAGYIENYRQFGNPVGASILWKEHSFKGKSIGYVVQNGTRNLLRFGFDFLSLDGLPNTVSVRSAQYVFIREVPKRIVSGLGIDLETPEGTTRPFSYWRAPASHEDLSYWGIFGFGLVWIIVFLSLLGVVNHKNTRILSFAAALFLFAQAYTGLYDPHRGRFFVTCALFAVPTIGIVLRSGNKLVRAYVLLIVLTGCISAVSAVTVQSNRVPVSIDSDEIRRMSIFNMDRVEQLTINNPGFYGPVKAFDMLVPRNATVAVFLPEDSYEYPLFGERLTRTIIPINSFDRGFRGIPSNADYVLYTKGFPIASGSDPYLGAGWFLRRLR